MLCKRQAIEECTTDSRAALIVLKNMKVKCKPTPGMSEMNSLAKERAVEKWWKRDNEKTDDLVRLTAA